MQAAVNSLQPIEKCFQKQHLFLLLSSSLNQDSSVCLLLHFSSWFTISSFKTRDRIVLSELHIKVGAASQRIIITGDIKQAAFLHQTSCLIFHSVKLNCLFEKSLSAVSLSPLPSPHRNNRQIGKYLAGNYLFWFF